jgi:ATP-binding cassette subfamily B protein
MRAGETGAGKSTLAKLITRSYDPTDGRVLIDGHDIREVTVDSLRAQLGVVPREPFLFAGSLRDDIAFAWPGAGDEQIWKAVRAVGSQTSSSGCPRVSTPFSTSAASRCRAANDS